MFDPWCGTKWAKSAVGYMVQFHNGVFAFGQIFEVYRQAKFPHSVEGVIFKPIRDIDRFAIHISKTLNQLISVLINDGLGLIKS